MSIESQAIHWKKEEPPATSRVLLGIWGGLILAVIGFAIFAVNFTHTQTNSPAKNQAIKATAEEEKAAKAEEIEKAEKLLLLPSFEGAKTIFVVAVKIPDQLLKDLDTAYQNGTKIQVITTEKIEAPYGVIVVDPARITADAVLINGASWHPLEREFETQNPKPETNSKF